MAPLEVPVKELDGKYVENIVKFVSDIRNQKLKGSNNIASATVTLLEQIINDLQTASANELTNTVRAVGVRLNRALPHELVCVNMVRRVLRAVRDEQRAHQQHHQYQQHQSGEGAGAGGGAGAGESLQRLVQAAPTRRATLGAALDLRGPLRDHLAELRLELESSTAAIMGTAREHVHSDELILATASSLVERFLRAARPRRYRLLLADTARYAQGHAMAARLAAAGVAVTVVSNASVYAVMSRVNKVVLGVGAALAGGGALAAPGSRAIASAAKHHSVPVIALAPLYKLSPLHGSPRHSALAAPHPSASGECAHAFAPQYDLIPPDHITLFVTNLGGSSPSYTYRLLSELYDPLDYEL